MARIIECSEMMISIHDENRERNERARIDRFRFLPFLAVKQGRECNATKKTKWQNMSTSCTDTGAPFYIACPTMPAPKPPPRPGSCGSVGLSLTPDRPPPPTNSGATATADSAPQVLLRPLAYRELVPVLALYTELARGSFWTTAAAEEEKEDDDSMRVSSSRSKGSERNLVRRSSNGSLVRDDVRREASMRCDARWPLADWARERPAAPALAPAAATAATAAAMEDASEGRLLCRVGIGCLSIPRRRCCCCCCCCGVMPATFRTSVVCASEKGSCSGLCSRLARRARAGTGCTIAACFSPYSGVMSGALLPTPCAAHHPCSGFLALVEAGRPAASGPAVAAASPPDSRPAPLGLSESGVRGWPSCLFFLDRRLQSQNSKAITASAAAPPTAPPMIMPVGGLEGPSLVCSSMSPARREVGVGVASPAGMPTVLVPLLAVPLDSVTLKLMEVAMVTLVEVEVETEVEPISVIRVLGEDETAVDSDAPGLTIADGSVVLCPEGPGGDGASCVVDDVAAGGTLVFPF